MFLNPCCKRAQINSQKFPLQSSLFQGSDVQSGGMLWEVDQSKRTIFSQSLCPLRGQLPRAGLCNGVFILVKRR